MAIAFIHVLAAAFGESAKAQSVQHLALRTWSELLIDLPSSGLTQFFYNRGGDGIEPLCQQLNALGAPEPTEVLHEALGLYQRHRAAFDTQAPWQGLFADADEFKALDRRFLKLALVRTSRELEAWARSS